MTAAKSSGRTRTRPTRQTKPVASRRGRPSQRGHPPRSTGQPDTVDLHDTQQADLVELEHDPLLLLATGHWNYQLRTKPTAKDASKARQRILWKPSVVELVYQDHLLAKAFASKKVVFLEQSQYLEQYLWPHYPSDQPASEAHIVSIVVMVNEKFRQRLPDPWQFLTVNSHVSRFSRFFGDVVRLLTGSSTFPALMVQTRQELLVFLSNCFQTLENDTVRKECMKIVTVSLWHSIQHPQIRETEFKAVPMFKKLWKYLEKKYARATAVEQQEIINERSLLPNLLAHGITTFCSTSVDKVDSETLGYVEKLLELVIELESLLPTRRYFHLVLMDHQLVVHGRNSSWYIATTDKRFDRFRRLVDMLEFYVNFEVDNHTGEPFTEQHCTERHYQRMGELQLYMFQYFPEQLRSFVLASVAQLEDPRQFYQYVDQLDHPQLVQLCNHLGVRTLPLVNPYAADSTDESAPQPMNIDSSPAEPITYDKPHLLAVLSAMYQRRTQQVEQINGLPLFPDENLLFDDALSPAKVTQHRIALADLVRPLTASTGSSHQGISRQLCYPLPRLNLQFLTLQDYLLRNFALFRLESAYEIRQDIEDAVQRLSPRLVQEVSGSGVAKVPSGSQSSTQFLGWSRMALPIDSFTVVQVGKPHLGRNVPSQVKADVTVNVSRYTDSIRTEWDDQVRPQDVLFLVTVVAKSWSHRPYQPTKRSFSEHFGIRYVRGCQVCDVLGDDGSPVEERGKPRDDARKPQGALRTYRVLLDPNQFAQDLRFRDGSTGEMGSEGLVEDEDMYTTFNVLIRRKPQENNFKAVLETMRGLMQNDLVVPAWLQSVLLGYGDPGSAHYSHLIHYPQQVDFRDTFLDEQHVTDSFPQGTVRFKVDQSVEKGSMEPPFMLRFEQVESDPTEDNSKSVVSTGESITVSTYRLPNMGPYPQDIPKRNTIRFTARQVEAIRAGCSPGLTLVVGPPGTGKTDVAVQTIANLYHTFPAQRILLVTHSNQALNQLFAKIAALDIAPRHLLRLGHGEEELEMEESFGKFGRVESFLQRRLELLGQVDQLAASLQVPGDHGATCETASYFYVSHILPRWEPYQRRLQELAQELKSSSVSSDDEAEVARVRDIIVKGFPFTRFFGDAPLPLFPADQGFLQWIENVQGCFRHLHRLFTELEGIRAFELLRTNADRSNYLLTKEARIIAMTCTHAALRRQQFANLGFQYDTVVMEEAAQILEVETFIPLLLQNPAFGRNRLKRVVLIGDHHQLPPVVKNVRFQKYGNMEQSLFTRLIRLGVPHIQLDRQGRARPCLAKLYSWRYQQLGNLPNVLQEPQYLWANPGFAYPFQMVDVGDYQGQGESQPVPYFYQNLGEAEYVVAVYQYMRLKGYPADKIAILTTYNGQRALIRDVLNKRCGWNPYFGTPAKVTTVDKYQGQQNDYILLSLVRTRGVGHIRDIRRLVVALSRSRLGLYIFGRRSLFSSCLELESTFRRLGQYPDKLTLVPEETYHSEREVDLVPESPTVVADVKAMGSLVYDMIRKQLPVHQPAPLEAQSPTGNSDSDHSTRSDSEEVQSMSPSRSSTSSAEEDSAADE